ncbi:GATA zinc finger domain-containing protein 10-like [Selaginella moellendorffii]|uniref:GATA zinc finger domain-containing protein 10-like n=1 Tax=Selaginella moellendorffii TaxID=88036 RepID=UPI000D1CBB27|nr:GATA zinc finger domain-containing protein 10-like [Selaginella moellendorffii]|eukprot:XP_024519359.1 GATA zinc finger domain-containing protein 10-like [Selaginella moellendorffii]
MVANGCMAPHEAVEEEVERLKMEIREVKALIWEGRMKLAATADAEERQFLREEQRWLFDETRKIRDEVRVRLEARNIAMQHQMAARFAAEPGCAGTSNTNCTSSSSWKMPVLQRPDTPAAAAWVFPDFVPGCGWPPLLPCSQEQHQQHQHQHHQQQQQRDRQPQKREPEHVDLSGWTSCLIQQQQQQQPQQSQERPKPRLPPLRPRKDGEAKTDPLVMQPPKSNGNSSSSKRKRVSNPAAAASTIKEEQDAGGREERGKRPRWKDHWVMQLIQVRGGMQEEFSKPPKQGVDLWRQVYTKLVASCPDFDKEPEACRKKWKTLVTDYKAASTNNSNNNTNTASTTTNTGASSGAGEVNERPDKCRYYTMMDEYISVKDIQTSVIGSAATVATIACLDEVTSELDCVDT